MEITAAQLHLFLGQHHPLVEAVARNVTRREPGVHQGHSYLGKAQALGEELLNWWAWWSGLRVRHDLPFHAPSWPRSYCHGIASLQGCMLEEAEVYVGVLACLCTCGAVQMRDKA